MIIKVNEQVLIPLLLNTKAINDGKLIAKEAELFRLLERGQDNKK